MLYEVMRYCRNFFVEKGVDGKFKIENGTIDLTDLVKLNQYMLIEGSVFNDGVHKYTDELQLVDEEFEGRITALNIPQGFIDLVDEMKSFQEKYGDNPFTSESFGGYSYSKATGKNGVITVFEHFKTRLSAWRKL